MRQILAILLITTTLSSPLAVLAEESSTIEAEPVLSNEIQELQVPVYLFADQNNGILGVTPVAKDLYFWAYATSSEFTLIGLTDATRLEDASAPSTEAESPSMTPLGLLVVTFGVSSGTPSQISESGEGVVATVTSTFACCWFPIWFVRSLF